jgi:hypothetical protein
LRYIWNTSHREFTVFDYYYFSDLEFLLKSKGLLIDNKSRLTDVVFYPGDYLIINYPEIPFDDDEIEAVSRMVEQGGTLIVTSYYQNEDDVAAICSNLLEFVGIKFNSDGVTTFEEGLLTTAEPGKELGEVPFKKVYFPCTCSLELPEDSTVILQIGDIPVAAAKSIGKGRIFAFGTAVFWDNFSIHREDNMAFINWLLP